MRKESAFSHMKQGRRGVVQELANVHIFLIQQEAFQDGRQLLDCSKSSSFFGSPLVMHSLEAQPRFCFFSPLKDAVSYLSPFTNPIQFNS